MQPNGISSHHRCSQCLALCLTYASLPTLGPPHQPFQGTIKPRLRWTSPISTLPSTRCPPPRPLLFLPLSPLSLLPPPSHLRLSCHSSIYLSLHPPSFPLSPPSICFTPPLRSPAPSYQPRRPPPLFSCCSCSAIVCGTGPADSPGQGR